MISLSLYSFYRVNEVQRFEYSRPIRKGEKNPDNEFAVKKKNHPQTHATANKTAHGKVCSQRLPQCRIECLCVLCAEILAYHPFKFSEMKTISQTVSLRCLWYSKKVTSALRVFPCSEHTCFPPACIWVFLCAPGPGAGAGVSVINKLSEVPSAYMALCRGQAVRRWVGLTIRCPHLNFTVAQYAGAGSPRAQLNNRPRWMLSSNIILDLYPLGAS